MASIYRVALVGGSDVLRSARRVALEEEGHYKVVLDSDGFGLTPTQALDFNFDIAVLDLRLPNFSAFDYVRALHAMAKVNGVGIGRILFSATFDDQQLRLQAIDAGAVDVIFVDSGLSKFLETVGLCREAEADYAMRQLLPIVQSGEVSAEEFATAATALDSLDLKERAIIENFCALKTDAQIAQIVQVPKLKVRQTITKAQNLLLLNTRSQLLLKLQRLGALTF